MYHTHMRPDRDDVITINWDNISPSKKKEFEKCTGKQGWPKRGVRVAITPPLLPGYPNMTAH